MSLTSLKDSPVTPMPGWPRLWSDLLKAVVDKDDWSEARPALLACQLPKPTPAPEESQCVSPVQSAQPTHLGSINSSLPVATPGATALAPSASSSDQGARAAAKRGVSFDDLYICTDIGLPKQLRLATRSIVDQRLEGRASAGVHRRAISCSGLARGLCGREWLV